MVLLLTRSEIKSAVTLVEAIEAVERGFAEYSLGKVEMPPRTVLSPLNGWVGIMSAYMREYQALATKVVAVYPENVKFNFPSTVAILIYSDPSTGMPLAVMDATYLTALRTGAASGVATKYLAVKDASILTIIGCGVQAETQLEAVTTVRDIDVVNVYDINRLISEKFAKRMGEKLKLNVESFENSEKAVKNAEILVTATTSKTPVVMGAWIREGCHINAIGAQGVEMREFDDDVIKNSKIIVDSRSSALKEAGDLAIPLKERLVNPSRIAEIGEIILGKKEGRSSPVEITFFKSVGLAVQDCIVAKIVYEKSLDQGLGKEIEFLS